MTTISAELVAECNIRQLMDAVWGAQQAKDQLDRTLTEALQEYGRPVEWEIPVLGHQCTIRLGHRYGDPELPAATCVMHHGHNHETGEYYPLIQVGRLFNDKHITLPTEDQEQDAGREATSTD